MAMMTGIFSSFDPCSSSTLFLTWLSASLMALLLPSILWLYPSRISALVKLLAYTLHAEMKNLLAANTKNSSTLILLSMFIFTAANNFLGLFPYLFTSTSHLVTALTLALPLWLAFMMFGWINKMNHMFTHLVPLSTPIILIPFMVLIETISNVIRPGTLTVRLSANMIAGHLLMTILASQTAHINMYLLSSMLLIQILLIALESAVAIIQAYVFTVLATLYASEV